MFNTTINRACSVAIILAIHRIPSDAVFDAIQNEMTEDFNHKRLGA